MHGLVALLCFGVGFVAWWAVARWLRGKGSGPVARHAAGAAVWFFGSPLVFGIALGLGIVEGKPAEPIAVEEPPPTPVVPAAEVAAPKVAAPAAEPPPVAPPPSEDPGPSAEMIAKAKRMLGEVEAIEQATRGMKNLRDGQNPGAMRKCVQIMREQQPKAEAVRNEANKTGTDFPDVGIAAGFLVMCASCLPDAEDSCIMARKHIADAQEALRTH